ncbi:MAG TPA: hypothetical protein VEL07_00710 [Planctomycetota bacterium]|nr:hypothetical protein [Planctomycetota bacterium]
MPTTASVLAIVVLLASVAGAGEAPARSPLDGRSFDLVISDPGAAKQKPATRKAKTQEPPSKLRFAGGLAVLSSPVTLPITEGAGAREPADADATCRYHRTYIPVEIQAKGKNAIVTGTISDGFGPDDQTLRLEIVGGKLAGTFTAQGGVQTIVGKEGDPDLPPALLLARARDLAQGREPKRAVSLLRAIVEGHRYEPWVSAPALVQWIECHQALRGDKAAEREYAKLAARWLGTAPALDGAVPGVDAVREELLWRTWSTPAPAGLEAEPDEAHWRPAFAVDQVDRSSSTWDGKTQKQVQIRLKATIPAGMRLVTRMGLADEGDVDAMLVAGTHEVPATHASLSSHGDGFHLYMTFAEPPRDIETCAVRGELKLRQHIAQETVAVPLREGATWAQDGSQGTVTSCSIAKGSCSVGLEVRGGDAADGGASARSSSSSGFGGFADDGAAIRLANDDDMIIGPNSSSVQSTNGVAHHTLTFATPFAPTRLLIDVPGETSTRSVAFAADGIELP